MASIVDSKKQVFGQIAAFKTITEGMPKFKLSSSMSSINNSGDVMAFLTDLINQLIGYEQYLSSLIDIILSALPRIEKRIKKALMVELKNIVSCGVDPSLPSWIKSTGNGIVIPVNKIDLLDILRTDPNSQGGQLLYSDTTTPLASTDFNTFLYGVIQDEGQTHVWKNIFDIRFDSIGLNGHPNNALTIKANANYDSKTLTDLNNDFVNSLTLFRTENAINQVMDIIYGTVSSTIGKSLKQLEKEAQIHGIIDKMVNNVNKNPLNDSAFSFTKEETLAHQVQASARKAGTSIIKTSVTVKSNVPVDTLSDFNNSFKAATTAIDKRNILSNHLNIMANASIANIPNPVDGIAGKANFIIQIILNLVKSLVNNILSPKVVFIFLINFLIVYGPTAVYGDGLDFIKKNKRLFNAIILGIVEIIVKALISIALKYISILVAQAILKKQQEQGALKLAQLQTLVGVPFDLINNLLQSLI